MPSDGKDLAVILQAQEKRDLAPNVTSQVISEMKSSLIFQYNWEELLQSAPTAISCMGACFVASSSEKATVTLTPPEKGFQYLRYTSIQANLVECGNLGRYAFLEAENGMGIIQLTSRVINGKINDIIGSLSDPMSAKKLLRPQLDSLNNGAQKCFQVAVAMDKKFEEWLFYVCEMHAACVQQEVTTRDTLLSNEICLAAEATRLDYQKGTVDEAKKVSETLGKQVGMASEAFKKASDEFPTGWDLMGQQIVGDLAGAVTSALNAAIPALLDNLNPMAKAKAGANMVGSFIHGDKDDKASGANGSSGASAPSQGQAAQPNPQSAVPKQLYDPAYPEIQKITTFLAALQVIVSGKDSEGNIDWEKARGGTGSGAKAGAKSSVNFLASMVNDAKTRFSQVATAAEPSTTLAEILDVASRIASEIEAEVKKSKDITASYPAQDSAQVKKWQSEWAAQYRAANTLLATAKTIPGTSANGIPLMASQDPAVQTAQINAKTAQAQAVLESAKNRLSTTQQMLTNAQENYVKTTEMLLEQQNKLGEIQANLSKLTATNISLAEIKRILIECIKLIINLKQQISNLVRFFKAMAAVVEICVKFHVEPFLDTVKAIVAADGTDPYKELKIGDFTLTDFQRSQVFSATVTLRSYFGVFGDIAKMWCDLSRENVIPGLRLCDELSMSVDTNDPGQMKKRVAMLDRWSREAADRVSKVAREKQAEILNGMESRIEEVKATTQQIEPPPESALKAIAAGTEVTKEAANKSIQTRAQASPLSRFSISEDD